MLSATACVAWLTGGRAVDVADRVGGRRDGLATNHGLVEAAPGGWRLRAVVDEYQCLCSEYRSNTITSTAAERHHSILSRFCLSMTSGGSMQHLAPWGREGKPSQIKECR